jgi:hypothetical protein
MIFQGFLNPESFLYRIERAELLWDLKKNVLHVMIKYLCVLIPWKNGGLRVHFVGNVTQKKSMSIIQENMSE